MNNMFHTYVRDRKNNPVGIVLALRHEDNTYSLGWSYVKKAHDKFNKELGLSIAMGRAVCAHPCKSQVPHKVKELLPQMEDRAKRYFKNCNKKFDGIVID
jgi:hypothetical protein